MKTSKTILLIVALCAAGVLALYAVADKSSIKRVDFKRTIISPLKEKLFDFAVDQNSYIAGHSGEEFYLANRGELTITRVSLNGKRLDTIAIHAGKEKLIQPIARIDSPFFFIKDGSSSTLLQGKLGDSLTARKVEAMNVPFIDLVTITSTSFVLRSINAKNENTLLKYNRINSFITPGDDILTNQEEGIFSTAGALHYSRKTGMIVYVYYYRNSFVLSDTLMRRYVIGMTVDTTRIANLKPMQLSENKFTLASPASVVNPISAIYDQYLLVGSLTMGQGESEKLFSRATAIDVYRLPEARYMTSFYVPDHENEKLQSFSIIKNSMLCLYDHHAVLYFIDTEHFETLYSQASKVHVK